MAGRKKTPANKGNADGEKSDDHPTKPLRRSERIQKKKAEKEGTESQITKAEGKGTSQSTKNNPTKSGTTKETTEPKKDSAGGPTGQDLEQPPISPEIVEPPKTVDDGASGSGAGEVDLGHHQPDKEAGSQNGQASSNGKRKSKEQEGSDKGPPAKSPKVSADTDVHSDGLRKLESIEEFTAAGWLIGKGLPKHICCIDAVNRSRLPSPLVDMEDQQERVLHFIDNHCPSQVRILYRMIRDDAARQRSRIVQAFEDAQGVFIEAVPKGSLITTRIYPWRTGVTNETFDLGPNKNDRLEVCTVDHTEGHHPGQFIVVNKNLLTVNESVYGPELLVGPLPEFAVIVFNRQVLFWWRSIQALNYVPHGVVLQSPDQNVQHDSHPSREDWPDILRDGLGRHNAEKRRSKPADALQIRDPECINFDSILIAIGSIWNALRKANVIYAFGGSDVFEPDMAGSHAHELKGCGVVGGVSKFIMPLWFPPEVPLDSHAQEEAHKAYKAGHNLNKISPGSAAPRLGHIAVASANRIVDGPNGIVIDVFDSAVGYVDRDVVGKQAFDLAHLSSWEGRKNKKSYYPVVRPRATRFWDTPQQPSKTNACGLYTILNAWAIMLEIPHRQDERRRGIESDQNLLHIGWTIVNLALAGFMDSRTIQAYLNEFGLCERQDPAEGVRYLVNATRMNQTLFDSALDLQNQRDILTPQGYTIPSPDSEPGHGTGESSLPPIPSTSTQGPSTPPGLPTGIQGPALPPNLATGTQEPPLIANPEISTQAGPGQSSEEDIEFLLAAAPRATTRNVLEALNLSHGDLERALITLQANGLSAEPDFPPGEYADEDDGDDYNGDNGV